eukprot:scaffold2472_cov65-Phaeocystis_antarctica.AAC.2
MPPYSTITNCTRHAAYSTIPFISVPNICRERRLVFGTSLTSSTRQGARASGRRPCMCRRAMLSRSPAGPHPGSAGWSSS